MAHVSTTDSSVTPKVQVATRCDIKRSKGAIRTKKVVKRFSDSGSPIFLKIEISQSEEFHQEQGPLSNIIRPDAALQFEDGQRAKDSDFHEEILRRLLEVRAAGF